MPKKTVKKKKARQAAEREQAKRGNINVHDGNYRVAPSAGNAMVRDYFAGYKLA